MAHSHLGFTGTQRALSLEQESDLEEVLRVCWRQHYRVLHHGDCIGADATAHRIARQLGYLIEVHPPVLDAKRAFLDYDVRYPPQPYLARNHEIVHVSSRLIAAPRLKTQELRSGTWATVRYARTLGRPVLLVLP